MLEKQETGNERYWANLSKTLNKYQINYNIENYPHNNKNGLYRILFGFNNAIKLRDIDIIHVQNFTPFIKTVPIVNTVHDLCFKYYPNLFGIKTKLAFNYLFKRSLNLSDIIICVSENTKKTLIKYYKIDKKKIFVVYEAADNCFKHKKNKNEIRDFLNKKFNIKSNYFLIVGNVENRKLPHQIIKAFNKIEKEFKNTNIVFAGHNKLKLKEKNNIRFLGYVSDKELNLLYNGAISLIYLSLCEGFGLPLIEAMTTKIPIICSDIPVFREITRDCALYVKNVKELSSTMRIVLKNRKIREKYSFLGFNRSKFFSWEKTALETLNLYKKALKK
jgi:glycosyltransferase involved in cell wall biosynthesis